MKMLRRIAVLGVIAAADVPAVPAEPQMDPGVAKPEAFLAAASIGPIRFDRVQMVASLRHRMLQVGFAVREFTLSRRLPVGRHRSARRPLPAR